MPRVRLWTHATHLGIDSSDPDLIARWLTEALASPLLPGPDSTVFVHLEIQPLYVPDGTGRRADWPGRADLQLDTAGQRRLRWLLQQAAGA